jgi:hypothetical protein
MAGAHRSLLQHRCKDKDGREERKLPEKELALSPMKIEIAEASVTSRAFVHLMRDVGTAWILSSAERWSQPGYS